MKVFVGGSTYLTGRGPAQGIGVAVDGDAIVAVGPDAEFARLVDDGAEVIDLKGGLLSPSFQDSHLHPIMGGLELGQCNLVPAANRDECIELIRNYVDRYPDREWVVGGGWQMSWFPGGTPTRQLLDEICEDRPISLSNADHHGTWVNTLALKLAGITAQTPDPDDGRIERDAEGGPSGTLHEGAARLVDQFRPPRTFDELYAALLRAQEHCLSLGITGWQDAAVTIEGDIDVVDVYLRAVSSAELKARVTAALWYDRQKPESQVDELLARRSGVPADPARFDAGTVKIMMDGVAENFTAAMSKPYLDACGHETSNRGISFIAPDVLKRIVQKLDASGVQLHFHALGDRAVTESLDALEAAVLANGTADHRHSLAHLQVVQRDDVHRFADLGAVANLQPYWARNEDQMSELTLPFLDAQLAQRQYPFQDFVDESVPLAGGSDWPVSSANPLAAIQVAVTRIAEVAIAEREPFIPEQAISTVAAWDAYTIGSSRLNHRDEITGSIEVGKRADLVVLSSNPFAGPPRSIVESRVVSTWIDGECVYQFEGKHQ